MATDPNAEQTIQGNQQEEKRNSIGSIWDTIKSKATNLAKDTSDAFSTAKKALEDRLTMQGQLKEARESLEKFLNPSVDMEKQIPVTLMRNAKGVVLLSVLKLSVGIGGSVGSGVVLTRLADNNGWSGPCSIGTVGGQMGFNVGAQKTNFVIILRDDAAVNVFTGKGQIRFGADAAISAGPLGRNAAVAVNANNKGYTPTVSYSESKGLYVGFALEGSGIMARQKCNEQYYGAKAEIAQIFQEPGTSGKDENYDAIVKLLTDYCAKQNEENQNEGQKEEENKQAV